MGEFIKVGGSAGSGGGATSYSGLTDKATVDLPVVNTPLTTALSGKEATSNKKTDVDANKTSDVFFPTVKAVFDWVSGLFVKGAVSSTDNAIARFDGATGKLLKNSSVMIDDDGKVGIGVTPANKLDVYGGMAVGHYAGAYAAPYNGLIISGAVGIGSSQPPGAALEITGNMMFANNGAYYSWGHGNGTTFIQGDATYGTGYIRFGTNGSAKLTIESLGNVGIGTPTPTATLDVNGQSRFRGNITFNDQIIDNVGSSGSDGQVLKKVGGLVLWANP